MGIGAGALAATSLAVGVLSAGVGAYGAMQSSAASKASANYQAQVANNNAKASAQAANTAIAQGQQNAQAQYQATSQRMGAMRAAIGANGIDLSSGSALDDQSSVARTGALNVNATSYNSDVQAVSDRNMGSNYSQQAGVDLATSANDNTSGMIGAGSSLLGGISSVSSKWASFQTSGATGGL